MDVNAEFIQLITSHQRALGAYILSLVPNLHTADEILQRTNLVVWEKREQFTLGTNFLAWACRIAHFEVLAYRNQQVRQPLRFDTNLMEQIGTAMLSDFDQLQVRRDALAQCVQKLSAGDQELIRLRYAEGLKVAQIEDRDTRSGRGIYKALARAHDLLQRCIERTMAAQEV